MLVDEKKLKWMGIDMRSRERRRGAVVATYAVFLFAVWMHPPRTYQVVEVLFWAGVTSGIWAEIEEAFGKWWRRGIAGAALLLGAWEIWMPPLHMHRDPVLLAVGWLALCSAVGAMRLVGYAGGSWMVKAMRKGAKLSWRGQRRLARRGFLYGLEGFAWNEYGLRFKELNDEQKAVVEQMQRANPQGKWMSGMERKLVDDERMRLEDNQVRARVQRTMTVVLFVSAVGWGWAAAEGCKIGGETVAAWAWTVFGLAITLRQAIVLWTEEDPRTVSGELEVMREQEA